MPVASQTTSCPSLASIGVDDECVVFLMVVVMGMVSTIGVDDECVVFLMAVGMGMVSTIGVDDECVVFLMVVVMRMVSTIGVDDECVVFVRATAVMMRIPVICPDHIGSASIILPILVSWFFFHCVCL